MKTVFIPLRRRAILKSGLALLAAVVRGYNAVEVPLTQGRPQTVIWLEALLEP